MEDYKKLLTGLLSTVYQIDEAGANSILFDESGNLKPTAKDAILEKDRLRVQKFKEEKDAFGNERYGYAERKVKSAFEQEIKDKFGIQSAKQGVELIADLIDQKVPKNNEVTEDVVKKHPAFLSREKELSDKLVEQETQFKAKQAEQEAAKNRDLLLNGVKSFAMTFLDGMKPVLSSDEKRKKNQLSWFEKDLESLDYQEQKLADGSIRYIPIDKETKKRLEDPHGNPIPLEEKVKEIAERYYDFEAGGAGSSAGDPNKKNAGDPAKKYNLTKPANEKEYSEALAKIETEEADIKVRVAKQTELNELFYGKKS